MDSTETPQHLGGGIVNYFQGATINKLVINGNSFKAPVGQVIEHVEKVESQNI